MFKKELYYFLACLGIFNASASITTLEEDMPTTKTRRANFNNNSKIKSAYDVFETVGRAKKIYTVNDGVKTNAKLGVKALSEIFEKGAIETIRGNSQILEPLERLMPREEELFDSNEEFGLNHEKAKQRQRIIRQEGGKIDQDHATTIVNLYQMITIYPMSKENYLSLEEEVKRINCLLTFKTKKVSSYPFNPEVILEEYDFMRNQKHKKRKAIKLTSNKKRFLKNKKNNLINKMSTEIKYNHKLAKSVAFEMFQKLKLNVPNEFVEERLDEIMLHFD